MSEARWVKVEGEARRSLFRKLAVVSAAIGIAWLVLSYVFLRDSIPQWAILIGLVGVLEGAAVYFIFGVERPDKSINDVWVDANGEIFSYLVKYVDANGKNRGPRIDFKLHCEEHGVFYPRIYFPEVQRKRLENVLRDGAPVTARVKSRHKKKVEILTVDGEAW